MAENCVVELQGEFDVEIRQSSSKKGRGLHAKRDFKEGDALFSERPLVSAQFVWNTVYQYSACDLCLRSLETAEEMCRRLTSNPTIVLPHPECCEVKKIEHVSCENCPVLYCSDVCRRQAWQQYHRTLCMGGVGSECQVHPISRLLEAWRQIHYPPESCSIMLIARMIASVKQSNDAAATVAAYSQFCHATVNEEESMAHKLLGAKFQDQLHLLRGLLSEALYEEEVQQWFTPEGFQSLFALIGTNGQGIGTSSFSVWVKNCEGLSLNDDDRQKLNDLIDQIYSDFDKVSGDFLDCEGSGLYTLQSSCNHSCAPNAEVTFPNNNFVLSVKALKDIKLGEEIFISYLDECVRDRSRHSRQKILRENYLFGCQCEKCMKQADDPDVTSEEEDCDSDCMDDCDCAH